MGANEENSHTPRGNQDQIGLSGTSCLNQDTIRPDRVGAAAQPAAETDCLPPEAELAQAQKALAAMRAELEATRKELEATQKQVKFLNAGGAAFGSDDEFTEFRRVMELERLGKEVLEKNAQPDSALEDIVAFYLAGVEKIHKGMKCFCMRLEGSQLISVAAPGLPASFSRAKSGTAIGEHMSSCGAAAFLGQKVIVTDIATDPRWEEQRHLALDYGLKACWSYPILRGNGTVLGTLAAYYDHIKTPAPEEEASLETVCHLLQLIMENKLAEKALRESNDRFLLATSATRDAIYDWDILTDMLYWGVGFEKIFGVRRSRENSTLAAWAEKIYPDDREKVTLSLNEALQDPEQDHWQMEYRVQRADGKVGYVAERGFIVRDAQQTAVRMVGALQEVTEQKLTEAELRKISVIAEQTINGIIIMSPDLGVEWVNRSFTKIMGYTLEDLKGKTPGSFMNGEETDVTLKYIGEQLKARQPLECELVQYAKSGRRCWLRLQAQPVLDEQGQLEGVFALLTDITQEKKEEQQLKLLKSVITNAHEAIAVSKVFPRSKLRPRTIFCNQAYLDITGYAPEEIIAKQPLTLHGPETDMAVVEAMEQAVLKLEPYDAELVGYRKSGEKFWAQVSLIPIFNKQEQITHWITMMRDITVRKNYEHERELLISELTQNNADLKQYSFIASHNLRAPLSNLKGIVNLIDMAQMPEGQNKLLIQKFKESTLQLNTVIDDLLEVLVIRNGVQVKKEQLNLAEAFEKVKVSVDELLKETGATVQTDFTHLPEVDFNPGYLHSILLNLLTNAIKYRSPDRPLEISLKTGKVKGRPALTFSDNGLGIDLNRFRDRIFGLYQRFHHHKDSKGMGLYIAQSQAKAMGGQLLVESEVNKGATFTLLF